MGKKYLTDGVAGAYKSIERGSAQRSNYVVNGDQSPVSFNKVRYIVPIP